MMWHHGRWSAFDLETTGVDVENDRVVTGAVISRGGDIEPEAGEWLADPGIEIPAEATDVHGITTEHARANGAPAAEVVGEITAELAGQVLLAGSAIVGHNVSYDLTLLDRECRRYELPTLDERLDGTPLHVIDTRVLDQHADQFRKRPSETQGPRQLVTLAQVYDVPWDDEAAHGCSFDALAAAQIARRIADVAHTRWRDLPERIREIRRPRFYAFRGLSIAELHALQVELAAEQAAGLQKHFRKTDPNAVVDGAWPLRPWVEVKNEGAPV